MRTYRTYLYGPPPRLGGSDDTGSQPHFPTPGLVLWEVGLVLATVLGFAVLIDLVLSAAGQAFR